MRFYIKCEFMHMCDLMDAYFLLWVSDIPNNCVVEITVQVMNGRKLMVDDAALFDYEEGGPNPRHDPRKPKPAGVDKNP